MITYHYKCETCAHEIEVQQRITEKPIKECFACKQFTMVRIISGGLPPICNNVTTLGQYASRQSKKMGHYEKEDKKREYKEANKLARKELRKEAEIKLGRPLMDIESKPELVDKNNKIAKMTPEQKKTYIETGKGL